METEQPDLFEQFFDFLSQIVMPDWAGLIALIPLVFIVLVVLYLLHTWWQWRKAGRRTSPRVPRPLPAGAPPPGVHMPGPSKWPFVVPIGGALLLLSLVLPPRDEMGAPTAAFHGPLLFIGLIVLVVAIVGWLREAMREWRATALTQPGAGGHETLALQSVGGTAVVAHRQPPAEPPPGVHMPGPSPWPFFAPIALAITLLGVILHPALAIGGVLLGIVAAAGWYREAGHEYRTTEAVGHPVPRTRDPVEAWPRRVVRLFLIVAVVSVLVAVVPGWLGGLGPQAPAPSGGSAPPDGAPLSPEITATTPASFETSTLTVPAGEPFELVFHNQNAGVPHDVAISDGPERNTDFFDGEEITGPASITYQVPALEEGDYYFLCTIHPNMNGTVEARPAP